MARKLKLKLFKLEVAEVGVAVVRARDRKLAWKYLTAYESRHPKLTLNHTSADLQDMTSDSEEGMIAIFPDPQYI